MKDTPKASTTRGAAKYPDITRQAKELGVSRVHLYLVLSGKRPSARLMARWFKLNKAAA